MTLGSSEDTCQDLLCSKCDIQIKRFKTSQWKKDVDYLFFRSYYDDVETLKINLVYSKQHTSYSCQCFWLNTDTEKVSFNNLRWFCNGHVKSKQTNVNNNVKKND